MEKINLIDTFSEFKENKNINRETLIRILEDSFRSIIVKTYGTDKNYNVIINTDKGDCEIWRNRKVVEDDKVTDPNLEISLSEAKKIDADFEIGEDVTEPVAMKDFGRRAILSLRQQLAGCIMELEKDNIYQKYKEKVGQIIVGEV